MDPDLHTKFCEWFDCDVSINFPVCTLTLTTADKKSMTWMTWRTRI